MDYITQLRKEFDMELDNRMKTYREEHDKKFEEQHRQLLETLIMANSTLNRTNVPLELPAVPCGNSTWIATQVSSNQPWRPPQPQPLLQVQEVSPCELYMHQLDNSLALVAHGRVYPSNELHHTTLQPNHVKVTVDKPVEGCERMAVPFDAPDDIEVLSQAIGAFIGWPSNLVRVTHSDQQPPDPTKQHPEPEPARKGLDLEELFDRPPILTDDQVKRLSTKCRKLYDEMMLQPKEVNTFEIETTKYWPAEREVPLVIDFKEIKDMLIGDMAFISIVKIFTM